MLYITNKIDDWYDVESMKSITNLSIVSSVVCATALLTQLGIEYYNTKTIKLPYGIELLQTEIVPLGAALICSVILFTSSIKFKKYVILCKSLDVQPTQMRNYRTTDWFDICYTNFVDCFKYILSASQTNDVRRRFSLLEALLLTIEQINKNQ